MADTKISALANGTPLQTTDKIPIARGAANFYLPGSTFVSPTLTNTFTARQIIHAPTISSFGLLLWSSDDVYGGTSTVLQTLSADSVPGFSVDVSGNGLFSGNMNCSNAQVTTLNNVTNFLAQGASGDLNWNDGSQGWQAEGSVNFNVGSQILQIIGAIAMNGTIYSAFNPTGSYIDPINSTLGDASAVLAMNYASRQEFDAFTNLAHDWGARLFYDGTGSRIAYDYNNRVACSSTGTTLFDHTGAYNSSAPLSFDATGSAADIRIKNNLKLDTVGKGIYVKEGTNATMGVVTLVGGTKVVSTTKVTANSRIFLTAQSLGTVTIGQGLSVSARTPGTSFTILSQSAVDTSVVGWIIFEPA